MAWIEKVKEMKTFSERWDKEERMNEEVVAGYNSSLFSKKVYKKWWFWVLVVLFVLLMYKIYG